MVDLNKIDFAPGSGMRSVALEGEDSFELQGEINNAFKSTQAIAYLAENGFDEIFTDDRHMPAACAVFGLDGRNLIA